MVAYRLYWVKRTNKWGSRHKTEFRGWFLFGLIPIYTEQLGWPSDRL